MANAATNKKTKYHHGDLRQALIDTATKMVEKDGVSSLSLRKLAEQVNVSRTAAYHHFTDKHDLLCAIAAKGFDILEREPLAGLYQSNWRQRTLAIEPEVILLDEPFSALDAQTKIIIQRNFGQTIQREGITTLLITHDLSEAVYMADRILVFSERPGRIVEAIDET